VPIHHFAKRSPLATLGVFLTLGMSLPQVAYAAPYRLIGWNNLGMHCMDDEFSLFSLLPPFNTIQAQLIDPSGHLVTAPGTIRVSYQAVADASGSINTTSAGKTDFWNHEDDLFGTSLPVDAGLAGFPMPGAANVPQTMDFDAASSQFVATGIPITPYDDNGLKNTYPMMRLVARNSAGTVLATTDIVLPVSDEMSCKSCHASGSSAEAKPDSGWANDPDPDREVRLNVLRLHDDARRGMPEFTQALADLGMHPDGLEATAVIDGRSVLCASCHLSEALPGSGRAGIPPLTQAMHGSMASATDPATGMKLDDTDNRSACYTCHPGSATKCLRGAMGSAVETDGSMGMQCQSCHGSMQDVASTTRTGWLDEPTCQSCHTGTATHNNGQIRYSSVFESPGVMRTAVDNTFATDSGAPAAGLSLYRFSTGHGGLQCQGCHGSTHAEYPSSHDSDNVQSVALQGHKGVLAECTTCHATVPATADGGPHGMHPIGSWWIKEHHDYAEHNESACKDCHGTDYRGTVLSRALGDRSFSTKFGTKNYFRGANVSCYGCHAGASSSSATSNRAPVVQDAAASTSTVAAVTVPLVASDADGNTLKLRIVSQPVHATVALTGNQAKYYPDGTYSGVDTFTFAAYDGSIDSNLGTARITVSGAPPPNQAPVVTAASASPNPVTGKTSTLVATATDDKGEAALVYTWSVVTVPSGASAAFSANGTNAAKATVATFTKAGAYLLRVTARDADNATTTRDVAVTVIATATSVVVSPSSASVGRGGKYQFSASVRDQFAVAMSPQPAVAWSITGTNSISTTGLATAGNTIGTYTVKATSSAKSGTATLSVRKRAAR